MKQIITLCSVTLTLFALFMSSCSEREDITPIEDPFVPPVFETQLAYTSDIKPILDGKCTGCHSGGTPSGSYNLSTYADIQGNGTDGISNAIAGDSNSLLITKLKGAGHFGGATPADQSMIFQWIVTDSLLESPPPPLTYVADIKPFLDANCIGCHQGGTPAGSYDLTTYAAVLGNGTDGISNAIAGNGDSKLITKILSGESMNNYLGSDKAGAIVMITKWVVVDSLRQN